RQYDRSDGAGAWRHADNKRSAHPRLRGGRPRDRTAGLMLTGESAMTEAEVEAAANEFAAARARGEYFPRAWAGRLTMDDAYRLLLTLIRRQRRRRVGWKVGLTAEAIQQQFRVHEPVFACLLDDGLCHSGHRFRHEELISPGFENELCIVLGRDLPADATVENVRDAVARVHPAFEIIETRGDLTAELALAI